MKFFIYIIILLSFNTLLANGPEMSPYAKTKSTVYSPVTVSVEELEINEVNIYSFDNYYSFCSIYGKSFEKNFN